MVGVISRLAGTAAATVAIGASGLLGQALWAANRPLPSFDGMDASGIEGPPHLPRLRLVALGDSTCTGPGLEDPADIWIRGFARSMTDRFQVEVRSLAAGGARAVDIVREQLETAVRLQPDIALVSVGGNDALRGVRPATFGRHLGEIVASLKPVSKLVALSGVGDLGAIPRLPRPLSDLARQRGRSLNRVHVHVAREYDVSVANQWRWATKEFARRPELFAEDQFHASARGHTVWAEVASETVAPQVRRLVLD